MREKILAELKKKYPGLQIEFLGFIAEKLSVKVTEDSQIEGALSELETLPISIQDQATFFQKESDRRVTEAKKKFETENPKPQPKPGGEPAKPTDPPKPDDETSKMLKELNEKITKLEDEKKKEKNLSDFQKEMTEKKIPAAFYKGKYRDGVELADLVTEIENDFKEFEQERNDAVLGGTTKPKGGSGGTSKKASDEEVKNVVDTIMP